MSLGELIQNLARSWKHHFVTQLFTLSVLSGVFTLIGIVLLLGINLKRVMIRWGDEVQMTVFLSDQATGEQVASLKSGLESDTRFKKVEWITKDRARDEFSRRIASYAPDLVQDPEFKDAFPASFQLTLASSAAQSSMGEIAKTLSTLAGVNDVSFGQGWIENYSKFVGAIRKFGWIVTLILAAGCLFIVGNTLRMSIHQRAEEIEILELIGATASRVAAPFIFEGIFMGTAASAIALCLSYAFYQVQSSLIISELPFLDLASTYTFFSWMGVAGVLVLGAFIGFMGSVVCVRTLSDGWSASRRKARAGG